MNKVLFYWVKFQCDIYELPMEKHDEVWTVSFYAAAP